MNSIAHQHGVSRYQSTPSVNKILDSEQLESVLAALFLNKPIKILRTIARTGRYAQGTSWVYIENEITGQKRATFVSFADILASFWLWLETVEIMAIALFKRQAIAEVVFLAHQVCDRVYDRELGWGTIVEKERTSRLGQPRFWLELDDSIEVVEPWRVLS